MSEPLEPQLRRALRPVDPGEEFTRAVMARIGAPDRKTVARPQRARVLTRSLQWLPAALAATLLMTIIMKHDDHNELRTTEQGLRARGELLQALRVTSAKLDIAFQVVHNQTESDDQSGNSGAQRHES
jgi:hypothetical protein